MRKRPGCSARSLSKFFFLLVFFSFTAQASRWVVNTDHSEIFFRVPYLSVSHVTGRFTRFQGELLFSEGKTVPGEVRLAIETSSIETGRPMRDGHLRSEEFLKARSHPKIVFESKNLSSQGKTLRAQGTLLLAGEKKPFTVEFSLGPAVTDTWNKASRFAEFRAKLNRKDFGLGWNKTLPGDQYLVGEEVEFWGNLQLQKAGMTTVSSQHMIPDTPSIRERERINRGEAIETSKEAASVSVLPPEVSVPVKGIMVPPDKVQAAKEKPLLWWISFSFLGLLGFLASIGIGIFIKDWVSKISPRYGEDRFLGLLTDALTIAVVFAYAVALWEVGWG